MAEGIAASGDFPAILNEADYQLDQIAQHHVRAPGKRDGFDCCVFYGLEGNTPKLFKDYAAASAAVYVDLGYWGRREGGRWAGYHKISVNARHPTAYFRSRPHASDRFDRFHVDPQPWRQTTPSTTSDYILLAGMGDKGARAEGYRPEQWERMAIEQIRAHTDRQIIYRPKPSWKTAKPIAGTIYSPSTRELQDELDRTWAVVTHHSNVAVDAILQGIPAFCWGGVATCMSLQDISRIEAPFYPDAAQRKRWANDIAYTQWSIAEMRAGLPWKHLKTEDLIP